MKNSGLFLNVAERSEVLMFLRFVFCVFGKAANLLKLFVFFPQFFGLAAFVGRFLLVYLGLEGLGVFVFLALTNILFRFCFVYFCCSPPFVLFCFVIGLLLVLFLFLFWGGLFSFCFILFCFS